MIIGCHLPLNSLENLTNISKSLGINTFQIFLRSPQSFNCDKKEFKKDDLDFFKKINNKEIFNILVHAPFVANGASNKENIRDLSKIILRNDLETLQDIDNALYVLHPGSHLGDGVEIGIERLADVLNNVLFEEQKTILLLETMAGKGNELGRTFQELADIIKKIDLKDKVGICLDTCHIWDAGYDLNKFDDVLKEFNDIIGLDKLKAIHLNNSKNKCGSKKDRHEFLSEGMLNKECIIQIINNPLLQNIPFCLETPINTLNDYKKDLEFLKECKFK